MAEIESIMDSEKLQQYIAELDRQIAGATHGHTKKVLQEARSKAESQLSLLQPYDKMGGLSDDLLNFNSDFYKQYQSYLQKTTGGTGANSLLAPLMAGGMSYAGGQNLVAAKQQELAGQRQDKINTGVQGFALQNIGMGGNLLGQQGNLGLGYANLAEQKRQYDDQNSGWNKFFGVLGQGVGLLNPFGGGDSVGGYNNPYTQGGFGKGR